MARKKITSIMALEIKKKRKDEIKNEKDLNSKIIEKIKMGNQNQKKIKKQEENKKGTHNRYFKDNDNIIHLKSTSVIPKDVSTTKESKGKVLNYELINAYKKALQTNTKNKLEY